MSNEKSFFDKKIAIYRNIFNLEEIDNFRNLVKKSLDEDLKSGAAEFIDINKKMSIILTETS